MASDLSSLIQNGLSETLESLLAKTAKLEQTTKAHPNDLKGQCIKVDTIFEFASLTTNWSFYIPALTASSIFNMMMMNDSEPTEELDDDILDALKEVISNISGGLTTTINSSDFEDLGTVKFSISASEIVDGSQYAQSETLFRIPISLDDHEIIIFINFDDAILPFIETITTSEVTQVIEDDAPTEEEEEIPLEEEKKELSDDEDTEELPDGENTEKLTENKDDNETKESSEDKSEDKSKDETNTESKSPKNKLEFLKKLNFLKVDNNLSDEEKKQVKLKRVIILVGGLLGVIILVAVVLYFTGAFEPEVTEEPQDLNTTKIEIKKTVKIKSVKRKKYITFNITQINTKRLNRKLSILTKYEILEEDAIEKLKAKEKEKLYKEQQARLEKFAKNNKEEPIFDKIEYNSTKQISKYSTDDIEKKETTLNHFIQIPTLKLGQFKSFIKKAKLINANLSICKDGNGKTQVYIGPFKNEKSRIDFLSTLTKKKIKDTKKLNLSKEEFNKRCSL